MKLFQNFEKLKFSKRPKWSFYITKRSPMSDKATRIRWSGLESWHEYYCFIFNISLKIWMAKSLTNFYLKENL
jgi:hypothetical protein